MYVYLFDNDLLIFRIILVRQNLKNHNWQRKMVLRPKFN